MSVSVTTRLTDGTYKALERLAEGYGGNKSRAISQAIKDQADRQSLMTRQTEALEEIAVMLRRLSLASIPD